MNVFGTADEFTTIVGSVFFWFCAVAAVTAAYLMVTSIQNMVRAALALTVVLACVGGMYGVLGADFLAVIQLVVYVGAIMVLLIFAIFMTPGQVDVPGLVGRGQQIGAAAVALLVFLVSAFAITAHQWNDQSTVLDVPTTETIGSLMLTSYVLPFEIASVLLTVALVGAIVIARED
jgi:NADH-quinone oxidoreductase subunit J